MILACQRIVFMMRLLLFIRSSYPQFVLYLWGTQINKSVGLPTVQKCTLSSLKRLESIA